MIGLKLAMALAVVPVLLASGCVQDAPAQNVTSDGQAANYTLADVAMHSTADGCWMAIHGKVYDVTTWIPMHPGGNAILEGCGKDATTLFETRPMGSGTPHSDRARSLMQNYYIGELSGGG